MNLYPNEDIGSPVMELNDFGDIGEQFLQTGIVVGPSGDWDCGPKAISLKELSGLQRSQLIKLSLCIREEYPASIL